MKFDTAYSFFPQLTARLRFDLLLSVGYDTLDTSSRRGNKMTKPECSACEVILTAENTKEYEMPETCDECFENQMVSYYELQAEPY